MVMRKYWKPTQLRPTLPTAPLCVVLPSGIPGVICALLAPNYQHFQVKKVGKKIPVRGSSPPLQRVQKESWFPASRSYTSMLQNPVFDCQTHRSHALIKTP